MRKILRKMYLNSVPRRSRKKTSVINGEIILGTWRKWLKNGGPKKYIEAIERKTAKV